MTYFDTVYIYIYIYQLSQLTQMFKERFADVHIKLFKTLFQNVL